MVRRAQAARSGAGGVGVSRSEGEGAAEEMIPTASEELHLSGLWFADGRAQQHWHLAFEAYGHAMACASALELQLGLTVLKGLAQNQTKIKVHQNRILPFSEQVRKMTFPKLIALTSRHFALSPTLHEGLQTAKSARDYLAHNFWQAHVGNLSDQGGVELISSECAIDACHFLETSRCIQFETQIDVTDFIRQSGLSSQSKREEWRRFIEQWIGA